MLTETSMLARSCTNAHVWRQNASEKSNRTYPR